MLDYDWWNSGSQAYDPILASKADVTETPSLTTLSAVVAVASDNSVTSKLWIA